LIEIEANEEDYLCDFTFDFYWQHKGARLNPDEPVGGFSRREIVESLKKGETVLIKGDVGSALGSSLGVDLVKLGGKGGPVQKVGSIIIDGNAGKRMGISMLRGAIYLEGQVKEPIGNIIEVESDKTGYRKFVSITEALETEVRVLEPNFIKDTGIFIIDGLARDTVGARNSAEKNVKIDGNAGMSTGILMRKGQIIVNGNAGRNTGVLLRGGRIVVLGKTGDFTGAEMQGGEIFIKGDAGGFSGARMKGGAIYAKEGKPVAPAKEKPIDNDDLRKISTILGYSSFYAMMYKKFSL
jgi:formylmethanofuran dehydrogenase subunit C